MPLDTEEGRAIASSTIQVRCRDSLALVPVDALPSPAYGFEPNGWLLYRIEQRGSFWLQGDWFVAVHAETGEFKDLGRLGD